MVNSRFAEIVGSAQRSTNAAKGWLRALKCESVVTN
jgi:hypothetical protein